MKINIDKKITATLYLNEEELWAIYDAVMLMNSDAETENSPFTKENRGVILDRIRDTLFAELVN